MRVGQGSVGKKGADCSAEDEKEMHVIIGPVFKMELSQIKPKYKVPMHGHACGMDIIFLSFKYYSLLL